MEIPTDGFNPDDIESVMQEIEDAANGSEPTASGTLTASVGGKKKTAKVKKSTVYRDLVFDALPDSTSAPKQRDEIMAEVGMVHVSEFHHAVHLVRTTLGDEYQVVQQGAKNTPGGQYYSLCDDPTSPVWMETILNQAKTEQSRAKRRFRMAETAEKKVTASTPTAERRRIRDDLIEAEATYKRAINTVKDLEESLGKGGSSAV